MSVISTATDISKLYFRVVSATISIVAILIGVELLANFHGLLWIPGCLFLASIGLQSIIANSPPVLIFSVISSLYTLIPFIGDLSVGATAKDLHEKIKKLINAICTAFALISLFLFVVYIDSDYSTRYAITFCFLMGFSVLAWYSVKVKSESKVVWKFVFLAGLLIIGKATAMLYPMPIHDVLGIYPGIVVDKSITRNTTRAIVQRDSKITNDRNEATLTEFSTLLEKFSEKTSDEIILFVLKNYSKNSTEYKTVTEEKKRRANTSTKSTIRKVKGWLDDGIVFEGDVFPQLGGAFIANVQEGQSYTIQVSGCRDQYNYDSDAREHGIATMCAGGECKNHGYKTWVTTNPQIAKLMLDGSKPEHMVAIYVDDQPLLIGGRSFSFTPKKDGDVRLTTNSPQKAIYFNKSNGTFHVKMTRKKS